MKPLADAALARLGRLVDEPDLAGTPYRLVREVGRGGMGTVYEVWDERLERPVALKALRPELSGPDAAARMLREARVVARLAHPGVVPIHDVGTLEDGRVFYAMKLVDGTRLDEVPATTPSLPELLRVFQKVCEAVAFAHAHGVVHRDLKPENVMVGPFGEVLVMDWGLAKLVREAGGEPGETPPRPRRKASGEPRTTLHGTVMGTPGYMAPEQARGEVGTIDERADVYSLGMILRFLLADVGGVPRPLEAVAAKATAEDPALRYADAAALADEVRRLLDERPVSAYRESWLETGRRFVRRYRTPIVLILTYLLVRALMLVFLGR